MSTQFINGSGKPRLILVLARPYGSILTISDADDNVCVSFLPHKLITGMSIRISGSNVYAYNADFLVTVIDNYTFTIPAGAGFGDGTGGIFEALTQIYESTGTTTFTATTAMETGSPSFPTVPAGGRVFSWRVSGGLAYPTFGKEISIATGVITVDGWTNGTPTNGQLFRVDGYITDLPRCQEMTEIFDPDVLIHSLYAGDAGSVIATKMRGWKYQCVLDYSKYISSDTIFSLRQHLAQGPSDQLILIPRADAPQFQYNVYWGEAISLTRQRIEGHKKPVFTFKGKENLASWPILSGYGTGYAQMYGTQL